jgi:hypothetical protein
VVRPRVVSPNGDVSCDLRAERRDHRAVACRPAAHVPGDVPRDPEYEAKARRERQPRPGLLARLFTGAEAEPAPTPAPFELPAGEGDLGPDGDFEKSWGGLHYLLTGAAWDGEPPLNFLMHGRELDIRDGDSPVVTHGSAETRRIAEALTALSDGEVRRRANPEAMNDTSIAAGGTSRSAWSCC